jgi:hypothetical protein
MTPTQTVQEDIAERLLAALKHVEEFRGQDLSVLADLLKQKNQASRRELDRLSRKLGKDHPRVEQMAARLDAKKALLDELKSMLRAPEIPGPKPEEGDWKVSGQVLDPDKRAAGGLMVRVFDKDLKYSDLLGTTETDPDGKFQLTYQTKDFRHMLEKNPDLYIEISDGKKVLYTSKEAVRFNAGSIEEFEVNLPKKPG